MFSFSLPNLGTPKRRTLRAENSFLTGQDTLEIFKSRPCSAVLGRADNRETKKNYQISLQEIFQALKINTFL